MIFPIKRLAQLGFSVLATEGTAETLRRAGVEAEVVRKHSDPGEGPTIVDRINLGHVRPRAQHADRAAAPAPTATRSALPP